MANIFEINRVSNKITLGTTDTTINITSHTASRLLALDTSKNLEVVTIGSSLDYTRPTLNTIQDIRTSATPLFAGIIIADGGTIGQSAGPLLTFDDAGNRLLISGCKVGIGITPAYVLHIKSTGTSTFPLMIIASDGQSIIGLLESSTGDGQFLLYDTTGTLAINMSAKVGANSWFLNNFSLGTTIARTQLTIEGTLTLKEQASADADTAAYGQLWVKNTSPCQLWFTNDTGVDLRIVPQDLQTTASPLFARLNIQESAASGAIDSGWGQLWVKNTVPTELWFRDDSGVDHQIAYI